MERIIAYPLEAWDQRTTPSMAMQGRLSAAALWQRGHRPWASGLSGGRIPMRPCLGSVTWSFLYEWAGETVPGFGGS